QDKARGKRLGELLVESGMLSREELHAQIRIQIEEAVYYLFTWTAGTFNFEGDVKPEEQDFLVSINPESLLLEGARRVDEWSLIEKKIPSFDLVFDIDRKKVAASDVELTREQEIVLDLLDGRRDVARVIDDSGLGEFDVGKSIYGLITAGFAHRVGRTKAAEPAVSDGRVDEHRNLGVAFYKTGMLDEAMREFRRVAELRETDAASRFYIGLALSRQGRWEEAVQAFTECVAQPGARASALHNLAYALERLGRYDEAHKALDEAVRRGGTKDPRIQTSVGVIALRTGDVAGADQAFQVARPLFGTRPPTAAWFHYAALTAALLGELDRAVALLQEGIAAHPHAAALFNNLAAVHERRGQYPEALQVAERGVLEDSGLAQLHKNLGDLHYRAARYDDALESLQRAVKISPQLGDDVYLKLGNIRFKRQERGEAVRCWEEALALDPSNAIVRTNLDAVRQVL
ncbi:MAG TPA: tetratricopeptide repeat protein, partial [Gemmatimonadaceae bacterium]|nr:tetratricopeptide repeat protein [Gemmatimonadaceae bacterium]